jgi:hypothetical protein
VPHTAKLSNIPVAVSNTTCEQCRERKGGIEGETERESKKDMQTDSKKGMKKGRNIETAR